MLASSISLLQHRSRQLKSRLEFKDKHQPYPHSPCNSTKSLTFDLASSSSITRSSSLGFVPHRCYVKKSKPKSKGSSVSESDSQDRIEKFVETPKAGAKPHLIKKPHNFSLSEIFEEEKPTEKSELEYENEEEEWELDEMPPDIRADYEARLIADRELRLHNKDDDPEYNMAMGLSSFRQPSKKSIHTAPATKALETLSQKGFQGLDSLSGLDYESLKKFATENEFKIEDYFTKTKTAAGTIQEFNWNINEAYLEEGPGSSDLIEHSYEYLKSQRANPKNFRDRIRIRCQAGQGGRGGVSFYRDTRVHKGPPDGGDGGNGGNVIFIAAENRKPSLASLQPAYRAGSGGPGSKGRKTGKNGQDAVIEVPLGTTIIEFRNAPKNEEEEEEVFEDEESDAEMELRREIAQKKEIERIKKQIAERTKSQIEKPTLEKQTEQTQQEREAARQKLFADPRDSIPWQAPELPETHPLKDAASQFHSMIESYNKSKASEPFADSPFSRSEAFDEDSITHDDLLEKYRLPVPEKKQSNLPRTVELDEPGAYFVAARGGAGGIGNWRLGAVRGRPQAVATPGKPGEQFIYQLELKLIADVGIVGFPNAGKSTFLSSISRANPKIASYPFTTLCPEIGTVELDDYTQFTVADLPGLIEGAHQNRGLGHQFLKHIERTNVLLYMIDMSGGDKRDPWQSFLTLWDELEQYQPGLAKKPAIIVANKMDAGKVSVDNLKTFSKNLKSSKEFKNLKIYPISAGSNINVTSVIQALRKMLDLPVGANAHQRFKERVKKVGQTGIVTMNIGSHLSESMRNIK